MMSRFLKGGLIGFGALIISTLGIFAADVLQGIDSRLSNLASLGEGVCPKGMVTFNSHAGILCVDTFEVSTGETCPNQNPKSVLESEKNVSTEGCQGASLEKELPWTFVTLAQAQRICAESGKRLPTSDEWYALALGTPESPCVTNGDEPAPTGSTECVSSTGAYDMVGNVWEWTNETVNGLSYQGRTLPGEGFVSEADASGVAIATDGTTESELYGKDYFWSKAEGVFGMIRGGFYGSREDAGLYTINASVPTNFATQGVGFRCVLSR